MKKRDRRFHTQYVIEQKMGWTDYEIEIGKLYIMGLCGQEIADIINKDSDIPLITPRSIQRRVSKLGIARSVGDAFRLAMKKQHIQWAFKSDKVKRKQVSVKQRFAIMERDNFTCQLCGNTRNEDILEIDHIIPIAEHGNNNPDNLRVLCHSCNLGRSSNQ